MAQFDYLEFYIGKFSEDIQRQVVETLCSGVLSLGDMDQVWWVYYCYCYYYSNNTIANTQLLLLEL